MNSSCCYCVSPCKMFEMFDPFGKILKSLIVYSLTVKYNVILND